MLKMYIDNEEVVSKNDFTIKEEMLSASSTILNNTYPKSWEQDKDYISRFYYPKDYSKLILNKDTYYPHIDGETIEGSSFQITADTTLEDDYYFKGNTYQEQTSGKNLIGMNYITGVTQNDTTTNDFTIRGNWASTIVSNANLLNILEPSTTYTISYKYKVLERPSSFGTNNNVYILGLYDGGSGLIFFGETQKNTIALNTWGSISFTFTTPSSLTNYRIIAYDFKDNTNTTTGSIEINELQIETGNVSTTFEPFTYGPTPNPNYPQEVQVVTGNQEIEVVGKNYFDFNDFIQNNVSVRGINRGNATYTDNSITITATSNDAYTFYSFITDGGITPIIKVEKNTDYTLSWETDTTGTTLKGLVYIFGKNPSNGNAVVIRNQGDVSRSATFNTGDYEYITFRLGVATSGNSITYSNIMLEKGNQATSYEAFKGISTYKINLGKNLLQTDTIDFSATTYDLTLGSNLEPGTYTISGANISVSSGAFNLYGVDLNNATDVIRANNYWNSMGTGYTVTTTKVYKQLKVYTNIAVSGNLQLEKGSVATSFSPYFTPIELCKINDYKDSIKKSEGKNLLDSLIQGNISTSTGEFETNPNTEFRVSENYIKVDSNKVGVSYITSGTKQIVLYEYKNDYTYITYQAVSSDSNLFTLNSETKYIKIRLRGSGTTTTDIKNAIVSNDSLIPYEPYLAKGKWYIEKNIGKVVLNGATSEGWALAATYTNNTRYNSANVKPGKTTPLISNYFLEGTGGTDTTNIDTNGTTGQLMITIPKTIAPSVSDFTTWLSTHNTIVYYLLDIPTYTEITNEELISQLNSIELLDGLNNISITSANLSMIMNLHYNYQTEHTDSELIFSGMVKNTNNISLNPREPKYCSLEILDYKTLLSEGKTLDYVISNKTILEAIEMVVNSISEYGFELGNVNILNGNEIIGAYSTENKTAYDVLQYLADISSAKWNCRRKDNTNMYIDFYDPTLMPRGKQIEYTNEWACENNLCDIKFNYGTRDYRNKQIILSDEVEGSIEYNDRVVSDGINKEYTLPYKIASLNKIEIDGVEQSIATKEEKEVGIYADFYYSRNNDTFTSNKTLPYGTLIDVSYTPIIKGREVVQNDSEIDRLTNQLEVNGTISRYENRNDTTDSNKLINIGETYLKYKGEAEITLTIRTENNNLYNVGQIVYFNAPIPELQKDYLVKSKQIQVISSDENELNIFYTFTLSSSFNAEKEINWFDNQRAKTEGNIGEGEFISRNIDINSRANIIWDNLRVEEVDLPVGASNDLQATLESPLIH